VSPTSPSYDEAEDTAPETLDVSPSFLLRNKAAPVARRRHLSFTNKSGVVVPGAAIGLHKRSISRRHSGTGLETRRNAASEIAWGDRMESIGLHVVEMEPDGNCLFRALSHQLYMTEDKHTELREKCVSHMLTYRNRFEIFCTNDFDSYCQRMRMDGTWASELEIRALEEIVDRIFSIYSSDSKAAKPMPMATNFDEAMLLGMEVQPVKMSYHGNHYNSIFDHTRAFPLQERKSDVLLRSRMALARGA